MQFFTGKDSWPPDRSAASVKRKHEEQIESSFDEEVTKKLKADNSVHRNDSNSHDLNESLHSPCSIDAQQSPTTQTSLPSPPNHPDRRQRCIRGTVPPNTSSKVYPPSPLSRSPEHTSDGFVAEEPISSSNRQSNPVGRAESRRLRLSNGSSDAEPLQIDTARAINDLDPRSPGNAIRKMASEGSRDKTSSHQQRSHDLDRPSSNHSSRRQSETMLPPPSAGFRLPRAQISTTTKTITPAAPKEAINPTSPHFDPPGRRTSTPKDANISSDIKGLNRPKATTPQVQASVSHNFTGFAQSIISTTSVNMKLENMNGLAIENVKESRRQEKHNVAYASLVDLTNENYGAIQKARMRLEKQFEYCNTNQDLIANALGVHHAQPPIVHSESAAINLGLEVSKELAELREELRKTRSELADQRDKAVRHKDLERFARKSACLDDLEQLVTREEFIDLMSKPSALTPDLKSLEAKVSDLADITTERHRTAQETQQRFDKQLKDLDSETSAARNTGLQTHTTTQTKLDEFEDDLGALKRGSGMQTELGELLKKSVDAQNVDSASVKEELKQLRTSQTRLEAFVRGDTNDSELGLSKLIDKATTEISQLKILTEQLQEKICKLEEGARKDSASLTQQSAPIDDVPDLGRHIDSIRQDLTEVTGATDELKQEFYEIADDVDKIRQGLKSLSDEYDRFKDGSEKQHSLLHAEITASAHTYNLVSHEKLDHVKLERLENDLQALDVFLKSQQLRFDNLTTEEMARSIIHQTKQLYKEHPGHVQDKLRTLEEQQRNVDAYITSNLQPRLVQVDTRISGRAGVDVLQVLNGRVQALEANIKEAYSHIIQTRKDLSEGISHVQSASITRDQGPDSARVYEIVITLREELKEIRSKHAELVEVVMTRHGKLRGDIQILNREIYTEAAGNPHKQAKLRGSMEYMDLIKLDPDDQKGTRDPKSKEQNKGMTFRPPVTSVSSSRQESVASTRNGFGSASDDESDAPISLLQERKRKRQSLPEIMIDEEVDDNNVRRRATGKGPQ